MNMEILSETGQEYKIPKTIDELLELREIAPYGHRKTRIQRSLQVDLELWTLAGKLKLNRTQILDMALAAAVGDASSDISKLEREVTEIDEKMQSLMVIRQGKLNRIIQLKKSSMDFERNKIEKEFGIHQAVLETISLLEMTGYKDLGTVHYQRLSEMTGKNVTEIKTFLKNNNYVPSEKLILDFYKGVLQ